jgi:uncharacterized hydrophobic protein (TIGR00271 family)
MTRNVHAESCTLRRIVSLRRLVWPPVTLGQSMQGDEPEAPPSSTLRSRMPSVAHWQDRLVALLGNSVEGRPKLVAAMLRRDAREVTSYWLQLTVSVGIATLGLVVGSTAVVIGAMLVAPLMGPIVCLAMGLATGSPFLVLRAAGRIGLSMITAVGGAAAITLMLPFHELNAEIAARASPTVLDLITAAFCALAGVYASLRPGSDTATTAAGTSISISLVPPLCASGYGLGTMDWTVAGGAALLFLTNLVAIVAVGTVSFVVAGFNRVNAVGLERDELRDGGQGARVARALALRLARLFESQWGPALRFLMPFALLAAVYVPLRSALDEVAWEVRARSAVRRAMTRESRRVVQSRVRVDRHEVELVVVLLGTTVEAHAVRTRLDREIQLSTGVVPRIEVLAVPDATAFAGLESTLLKPERVAAAAPALPVPTHEQVRATQRELWTMVDDVWPSSTVGRPLALDLGSEESGALRLRIVHLGPALGPDAVESMAHIMTSKLARPVRIVDVAVPSEELTPTGGHYAFMARVAAALRASSGVSPLNVCVVRPAEPSSARKVDPAETDLARTLGELFAKHPRVTTVPGDSWRVRFTLASCAPPSPADAGTSSDPR